MSLAILGVGTAVPEQFVTQGRAAELTSQYSGYGRDATRRLAVLYRRTGIRKRHFVLLDRADLIPAEGRDRGPTTRRRMRLYDEHVRPLARSAARAALTASVLSAAEISHLVTVSCTGFVAPGFDISLIAELGLPPTVARTQIGFMGCHGALNGLRVARSFVESEPSARVLLCAAEICSLHFRFGRGSDSDVANALFADGAAALVCGPDRGAMRRDWRVVASGSLVVAEAQEAIAWKIGNYGFDMRLSPKVPYIIGERLRPWLENWLKLHGLALDDVASWAIHPGGPRVLDAVEEALGLDRDATAASRAVLAAHGNMSSPTVIFILDRLRHSEAPRPCVALAFGPGLTIESTLFL